MEKVSIVDLKEICGRAWEVPACEVSLLLNPESTEVAHTRGTKVRLLVSQRHSAQGAPNPAQIIAESALKELEESIPLRRGAADDLRRQLSAQQHRVADGIAQRDRLRAMLGWVAVGADGHEANAAPSEAPKSSPGDKNCDCPACLTPVPSSPPEGPLWGQTTAGSDLTGRAVVVPLDEARRMANEDVDLERKAIALLLAEYAAGLPEDLRPSFAGAVEMVQQRVGRRRAVAVPYQMKVGEL